ncbi:NAD(P)/FAD-dependent oxidoreductase [Persicimonas caeni]|uniref:NADH:ubiquinone reductase (non-electrogenic) n=1 Tax=Persicimonas caeni TaxID=2292766 RepID=A0A4Y6PPX2_PERCE|nr:NAD(P)/FAD-dependent oxidoreductase [Persicimonas caeni]QDG50392.1 NAD(P)/FAD-dependent oxidoreductase [Persicimonas caeni]QED31613.1 NAD(P)/FAD-dependent oxidoreductase [Persicimonas caeni]
MASSQHDIVASDRPRVVILGAGFAGLNAARKLAKKDVDVFIVDRNNYHLFQPLLYQVATAGLDPSDISMPVRAVLGKYKNTRVVMNEVRAVDRQNKKVILERGELPYDFLIVATGAETKYFGPDSWEKNSTPLKTVEDALELRRKILTSFEMAEQANDPDERSECLTFVIIGAGPTGVEMAGAIREIAAEVMRRDFRTIDPEDTRVVLIDAQPHVLPTYPEELSEKARKEVERRGVEVMVNSPVDDIGENTVTVGDETIRTHTVIWAAGVATGSVMNTLDTELDRMGRARIDANLTLPDDPHVFVVGDAANFTHDLDEALPGLAPVAIQMGKHAAKNILRRVRGDDYEPFKYFDKGQMSTIGRAAAVVDFGKIKAVGFFAWVLWLFVHLMYLVGFKNRVVVLIEWAYSYLAFKRGSRIIIGEPEHDHPEELAFPGVESAHQHSTAQ